MRISTMWKDKMPSNYTIADWGDWQRGNRGSRDSAIEKYVRYIKARKNCYSILGGDLAECIHPDDKRFSIDAHGTEGKKSLAQEQRDDIIRLCEPFADRILLMLRGNHEDRIMKSYGDLILDVVKMLKLPETVYGGYNAIMDLGAFKTYAWHGDGSPPRAFAGNERQAQVNKEIWLQRKLRRKAVDCELMLMYHIHQVIIQRPIEKLSIFEQDGKLKSTYISEGSISKGRMKFIPEDNRWYAASGTALVTFGDGWETWAEMKGMDPTDLAFVSIEVKNDKIVSVEKVPL